MTDVQQQAAAKVLTKNIGKTSEMRSGRPNASEWTCSAKALERLYGQLPT